MGQLACCPIVPRSRLSDCVLSVAPECTCSGTITSNARTKPRRSNKRAGSRHMLILSFAILNTAFEHNKKYSRRRFCCSYLDLPGKKLCLQLPRRRRGEASHCLVEKYKLPLGSLRTLLAVATASAWRQIWVCPIVPRVPLFPTFPYFKTPYFNRYRIHQATCLPCFTVLFTVVFSLSVVDGSVVLYLQSDTGKIRHHVMTKSSMTFSSYENDDTFITNG